MKATISTLVTSTQSQRMMETKMRDFKTQVSRLPLEEQSAAWEKFFTETVEQLLAANADVISKTRQYKINPKKELDENPSDRITFVVDTANARAVKLAVRAAFEMDFLPNAKKTALPNISLIRVYHASVQYGHQLAEQMNADNPGIIHAVYEGDDASHLDLTPYMKEAAHAASTVEPEVTEEVPAVEDLIDEVEAVEDEVVEDEELISDDDLNELIEDL